jgi:hypothetical protein
MPHLHESEKRPADIKLPDGWDWDRVEAQRAKWSIADNMVPIATIPGACVAWGTVESARMEGARPASDAEWESWLARAEGLADRSIYNLDSAYISFRKGVTASDYAVEVVARAGELV